VQPSGVTVNVSFSGNHSGDYDNQKLTVDYLTFYFSSHYAHPIVKRWKIFGGGGFVFGLSSIKMLGTYPIYQSDPAGGFVSVVATDVTDPLDIQSNYAQVYGEIGVRADWNKVYLQLQGSIGKYSGASMGVGYKIF
jgi:hypothetical protein